MYPVTQLINRRGFAYREEWSTAREEWFDKLVDEGTGRKKQRTAIRKLRRTLLVTFLRWRLVRIILKLHPLGVNCRFVPKF